MNYETKRDVFDDALRALEEFGEQGSSWEMDYDDLSARYAAASDDAAMPDDLPVIPKLIGRYLNMWKRDHGDLFQAFDEGTSASLDGTKWESVQDWFSDTKDGFDTFARALVLGIWRVEETGEIVNLK